MRGRRLCIDRLAANTKDGNACFESTVGSDRSGFKVTHRLLDLAVGKRFGAWPRQPQNITYAVSTVSLLTA